MTFPPDLSPQDLATYFPRDRQLIKNGVFELGLVLAGTVSAGSYTAGVLDYLLEALDAWQRAKENGDPDAPQHEVVISAIGGASGGAINGAIMLRAAGWQFPHGPVDGNPFYSSWNSGVNLEKLLAPGTDDGVTGFASILKCASIDAQAAASIAFTGQPLGTADSPRHRAYLADPLRLIMCVGNLDGLPYTIRMRGETNFSHDLFSHGDYMRFALSVDNGVPNTPQTRPDEVALASTSNLNWDILRDTALATSAFPIAFRSRSLNRPMATTGYRVVAIPGENYTSEVVQLIPKWDVLSDGEPNPAVSTFVNVDGGTFNNQPLDLVRTALAGFSARNPRGPNDANRAVIMVDPFSDPKTLTRPDQGDLIKLASQIINSLIFQARFKPEDIALAYAEDVYSRFLISPVGPGPNNQRTVGPDAIAAGALGGFSGFIDRSFLDYDFRLGRFNAYSFLRQHLALPVALPPPAGQHNNPIFDPGRWSDDQRNNYAFANPQDPTDTTVYLPIIPLMRELRDNPPQLPPWPRLSALPPYLKGAVETRLQSVYEQAKAAYGPSSWLGRVLVNAYLGLAWPFVRGSIRDAAVNSIESSLQAKGLL